LRIAWVGLVVVTATTAALAETWSVAPDGQVHRIEIDAWTNGSTAGSNTAGTVLRHVVQKADGEEISRVVLGTDDFELERDPAIDLDPVTAAPILVWTRQDAEGHKILLSRFANGSWEQPRLVYTDGGVSGVPQIRATETMVHIFWKQDDPEIRRMRVGLDRESLDAVVGPEDAPISSPDAVSSDGGPDLSTEAPPADCRYFASHVGSGLTGGSGSIMIWGVRDEPIPIVYLREFLLPSEVRQIRTAKAGWIKDRFVLSFTAGENLYYTMLDDGEWTELRLIVLGSERTAGDGMRALVRMILRGS
jgi:hypothetical protein